MVSEGRRPAPGSVRRAGEVGVGIKLALVGSLGKEEAGIGHRGGEGYSEGKESTATGVPPTDEA